MTGQIDLYGIKNCDTVKKARAWLDGQGIGHVFHDYKVEAPTRALLERWCSVLGWEAVLNRAGTTFRALPGEAKQALDAQKAISLMLEQPSMIKRPIVVSGERVMVGFKPATFEAFFR